MTGHAVKQSHLKMKAIVFVLFAVVGAISAAPHRRQNPMNRFVNPKRRAYDAQIRPGYTGGEPLEVGLSAYLRDIGPVDTKEDSLQLDLTLRQQWVDERLAHAGAASGRGFVSLLGGAAFGIWRPDTFFRQSRKEEGHYQLAANQYARVEKDGTVLYSTRVGLTLSCPGLAKLETVKKHVCELDVASCKYYHFNLFGAIHKTIISFQTV